MLAAAKQQLMQGAGGRPRKAFLGHQPWHCLPLPYITQRSHVQVVCFLQGKVTQALTRLALGISPGIVDHVPALYDEFFALQLCSPPKNGSSQPRLVNNAGDAKSASPAWPG